MPIEQTLAQLQALLRELCRLPRETEWVEFKHNNADAPMIGEYISALANSAALLGKPSAYLVWGVDDNNQEVIGTDFKPATARHKKQELESWLRYVNLEHMNNASLRERFGIEEKNSATVPQ